MSNKNFAPIPSISMGIKDRTLLTILEPIRDAVQRRFQGAVKNERVVTREDLVSLGLVSAKEIEQLKD